MTWNPRVLLKYKSTGATMMRWPYLVTSSLMLQCMTKVTLCLRASIKPIVRAVGEVRSFIFCNQ